MVKVMALKDLFKKIKLPTKRGKTEDKPAFKAPVWESSFYLELINLEGAPKYELTHQLSIGSEIGNIVIADPSLSPRHCTFYLQQEVISLIDHGSIQGTLINGIKLSAGKFIILEESDKVQVGDLEVKILKENRAVEVSEDEEEEAEEEIEEEEEEEVEEKAKPKKVAKKPGLASMSFGATEKAANTLPRFFAIFGDILIAASLHAILVPFDDYKAYQDFVPGLLNDLLGQDLAVIWDAFLQDQPAISELIKDLMSEGTKAFPFVDILVDFAVLRFVSTLILGVSFSEFFLGLKSIGNPIWARVGGALRVLIGLITGPFVIFDVPALVSRRTFKEFLTFTHVALRGKILFVALVLVYIPACLALFLVSPMFQGFDFPAPVRFSDQIVKAQTAATSVEDGNTAILKSMRSQSLGFDIDLNEAEVFSYVDLKFQTNGKKKTATPVVDFYFLASDRRVELSVEKLFDLKELLSLAVKGNYFLHEKYPEITKYLYDASNVNKNFSLKMTAREELQFTTEIIDLLKTSLELSVDNFTETMESHTLMIKSLIEFKSSLLALVPAQFSGIDLVRMGNQTAVRFSYLNNKSPYDLILPLKKGQGIIYKIAYDKRNQLKDLKDSLYQLYLSHMDWKQSKQDDAFIIEGMDTLKVYDFIQSLNDRKNLTDNDFKNLYGYYHQLSKNLLASTTPHPELDTEFSAALTRVYDTLKSYIGNPKYEEQQNSLITLEKSFQDLINAFNEKNTSYFETTI